MKTRSIQTKIWRDDWFAGLNTQEKLAFIYYLTNPYINLCGIYELPDRVTCFDLGISQNQLAAIKETLSGKIVFHRGWVAIRNIEKYDDYKGGLLLKAKETQLSEIPPDTLSEINDALSMEREGAFMPLGNSNSNSKSNSKVIVKEGIVKGRLEISEDEAREIAEKYNTTIPFVLSKQDDVNNWVDEKPARARGRDLRKTLRVWVKKDALERREYAAAKSKISFIDPK